MMAKAETADQVQTRKSDGWQSRIVGYGEERPDQLMAHPENWRVHTKRQRVALTQLLDKVGWVQNVLVNKRTGRVLDGHLRVGEAIARGESAVPVTYVDLPEDEERLVLASLDPIASLAVTDSSSLMALVADVDIEGELAQLLRDTAGMQSAIDSGVTQDDVDKRGDALANALKDRSNAANENIIDIECPHCGESIGVDRKMFAEAVGVKL